jgi:hypothetical protein
VIGEQQSFSRERLHGAEEARDEPRIVGIRAAIAEARVRLRENRSAEAVFPASQVDEDQLGLAAIGAQARSERAARILDRRERRDDQRQRRDDLADRPTQCASTTSLSRPGSTRRAQDKTKARPPRRSVERGVFAG